MLSDLAWLARVELVAFGTNLVGYRLLPAVAVGLVTVLAGLSRAPRSFES